MICECQRLGALGCLVASGLIFSSFGKSSSWRPEPAPEGQGCFESRFSCEVGFELSFRIFREDRLRGCHYGDCYCYCLLLTTTTTTTTSTPAAAASAAASAIEAAATASAAAAATAAALSALSLGWLHHIRYPQSISTGIFTQLPTM